MGGIEKAIIRNGDLNTRKMLSKPLYFYSYGQSDRFIQPLIPFNFEIYSAIIVLLKQVNTSLNR